MLLIKDYSCNLKWQSETISLPWMVIEQNLRVDQECWNYLFRMSNHDDEEYWYNFGNICITHLYFAQNFFIIWCLNGKVSSILFLYFITWYILYTITSVLSQVWLNITVKLTWSDVLIVNRKEHNRSSPSLMTYIMADTQSLGAAARPSNGMLLQVM